ncbi:MAG: hypothetical protein IJ123_00375 [Blautia sp.]|nr:hypothetical protein [Blautia sp.]
MSGPKISTYYLAGFAAAYVLNHIHYDQNCRLYGEQISALLSACKSERSELDRSLAMLELQQEKKGGQEGKIEELRSLQKSVDEEIKRIQTEFNHNKPKASLRFINTDEERDKDKQQQEKLAAIKTRAQALKDKLDRAVNIGKEAEKEERRQAQQTIAEYLTDGKDDAPGALEGMDLSELKTRIGEDLGGILSFDDTDANVDAEKENTGFEYRKKAVRDELMEFLKQDLTKELTCEIRGALSRLDSITRMENLSTFESITVKKLHRDLKAYRMECEKKEAEFAEAVIRYQILCDMAGREDERDRTFTDKDELDKAAAEMEKIVVEQKEQAYIADCVDEVMADMGYDLIGRREVHKKSGRHFKNELYRFGEGTAVNITYSSEGQIAMELGGIAKEDRVPTPEETEVLTAEMESFCGEFAEFEKRMQEKGVIVGSRIALMPPAAEHAAIINVNDYETENDTLITEMSVTGKRKKAAGTKHIHMGDE